MIARPTGFVSTRDLDLLRDHLAAAKATEVLAAVATFDAVAALERRLLAEGHHAHQAPRIARRRHHDACVHDLLAGRDPDDARLWSEVIAADHELDRHKARHAAAQDARTRAGVALHEALRGAWTTLLPYLARQRQQGVTDSLRALAVAFSWPTLTDPPGQPTANTAPEQRWALWWPLSLDPDPHHRGDHASWEAWAWAQLAEGSYTTEGGALAFTETWTPPPLGGDDLARARRAPAVIVSEARRAEYAEQVASQR